jgi:hypothetical protein
MSRVVEAIHHIVAAGVVPQMHYLPSLTRLPIKKTRNNNPIVVPSKERIYIDTYLKRVIFSLTYSYFSFVGHCHVFHLVSRRDKGIDVDIFPSSTSWTQVHVGGNLDYDKKSHPKEVLRKL